VDDIDCRLAVLLRQRNGRECWLLQRLGPLRQLLPREELLCSRAELLCSRPDVCRSRAGLRSRALRPDVRRSRCFLLWQLQWLLPEIPLLQDAQFGLLPLALPQEPLLQDQLLQVELWRCAELLCSGSELRCSLCSDVRCSHVRRSRCRVLQLTVDSV
jgi:hypothetical protein